MRIKVLRINKWLGLEEKEIEAAKINIFKGPKGSGKSSIIEAIEKLFTNKDRRTETIKHGEAEAKLFVEMDNGLEIERRLRTDKAPYLKCRKDNEAVPSTEKFLRNFINGDIFRPLDWVNMSIQEQTKSILSMLQIGWSNDDIAKWFGEIPSNIDFNQHILQILKAIELKYYNDRQEVNREIDKLKTQIEVIKKEMPLNYDGEEWRELKQQEYYNKVLEAQKINQLIEQAKALQENFDVKVKAIEADADNSKARVELKFKEQRHDIKDIVDISKSKIEKLTTSIENQDINLSNDIKAAQNKAVEYHHENESEREKILKQIEEEYMKKIADAENAYTAKKNVIDFQLEDVIDVLKKTCNDNKENFKAEINFLNNRISSKETELLGLDVLEKTELEAVEEKAIAEVDKEKIRVGKASEYLENNESMDIEPLQEEADKVAEMQSYLRQWDMMLDIRNNKLAEKERYAQLLTSRVEKARTLPQELLKTAKMPVEGISVDEKGLIRINGTLIDGLSDGEQLELAFKIAKAQAGELKLICIDRWESLKSESKTLLENMLNDDFQYFITEHTEDKEFSVEQLG